MMRRISVMLLAGVALGSMPAMAQQVNTAPAVDSDDAEIVVFGQGETRQVQEVTSKELGTSINR